MSKSTLDCVNSLLKIPMATTEIRVAKSLMSMYAMLATGAQVRTLWSAACFFLFWSGAREF